jgi:hypothetical protein
MSSVGVAVLSHDHSWAVPVVVVCAAGLSIVLAPSWLRLFSPDELNQLISGGRGSGLDIADMARLVSS